MNSDQRLTGVLMAFPVYLFITCGLYAASEEAPATQSDISQVSPEKRVLASIETDDGHTVVFREVLPGMVIITEKAKIFQASRLGPATFGKSMTEIYRIIHPQGAVPDTLVAADARIADLKSKATRAPVLLSPPEQTGGGPGPRPYTAGEQDWFRQTYCHDTPGALSLEHCVQAWGYAYSGWVVGANFSYQVMVGSEGGAQANFSAYYWNGSSEVLIDNQQISPGFVHWNNITYIQPFFARANLDGAGNNTQVSLAAESCGKGGQWACTPNCTGTAACDFSRGATSCSIVYGNGVSFCNAR